MNFLFFLLFSGVFFFFANSNFLLIFLSSNTFSLFNEPLDFFRSTALEIFSNSVFFFLEVLVTPHCCFVNLETIMSHMRRGCVLGILVKHFLPEITISLGLSPGRLIAIRLITYGMEFFAKNGNCSIGLSHNPGRAYTWIYYIVASIHRDKIFIFFVLQTEFYYFFSGGWLFW